MSDSKKVKVLYQNLGGVWYAFASSGEQIFFGKVPLTQSVSNKETQSTITTRPVSTRLSTSSLKKRKTRESFV